MVSDSRTSTRRDLDHHSWNGELFLQFEWTSNRRSTAGVGFAVDVNTLGDCSEDDYDWCLLSNISEIVHAYGDEAGGLARIGSIGGRCRAMGEPFDRLRSDALVSPHPRPERPRRAGLILDLGLHDQSGFLEPEVRGLPVRALGSDAVGGAPARLLLEDDSERTIPWSFIGHATPRRAALVDHLVQSVDPRGFVYLPAVAPYTEKGSPHLNQEQFERVLDRTRYQVWCSHHSHFYMEPERFRSSLLTGGVPVKIVDSRREVPNSVPLSYLMIEPGDCGEWLTETAFARLRRRFWQDWRRFPTLAQEIGCVLDEAGIDGHASTSRAA